MSRGGNPSPSDSPAWMRASIDEVVIEVTANDELIEYLARELRVPRSALLIVRGETSRRKTIRIITHEPARIASRLRQTIKPS